MAPEEEAKKPEPKVEVKKSESDFAAQRKKI